MYFRSMKVLGRLRVFSPAHNQIQTILFIVELLKASTVTIGQIRNGFIKSFFNIKLRYLKKLGKTLERKVAFHNISTCFKWEDKKLRWQM